MDRWDRLVASFIEEYAARGVASATVAQMQRELDLSGPRRDPRSPLPTR